MAEEDIADIDQYLTDITNECRDMIPTDEDLLEILDEADLLYKQRNSELFAEQMDSLSANMGPMIQGITGMMEKMTGTKCPLNQDHINSLTTVASEMCTSAKSLTLNSDFMEKVNKLQKEQDLYVKSFIRRLAEAYPDLVTPSSSASEGEDEVVVDTSKMTDTRVMLSFLSTMMCGGLSEEKLAEDPKLKEMIEEYGRVTKDFEQQQFELVTNNTGMGEVISAGLKSFDMDLPQSTLPKEECIIC
jgi:hypothetical protein